MKKITIILLSLCLLLNLSACSMGQDSPDKVVAAKMESIKTGEDKDLKNYFIPEGVKNDGSYDLFIRPILNKLEYKIKDTKIDKKNNTAIVDLELTMPDMVVIFEKMLSENAKVLMQVSKEDGADALMEKMAELVQESLNSNDVKTTTSSITLNLTYNENDELWTITNVDDIFKLISGE